MINRRDKQLISRVKQSIRISASLDGGRSRLVGTNVAPLGVQEAQILLIVRGGALIVSRHLLGARCRFLGGPQRGATQLGTATSYTEDSKTVDPLTSALREETSCAPWEVATTRARKSATEGRLEVTREALTSVGSASSTTGK